MEEVLCLRSTSIIHSLPAFNLYIMVCKSQHQFFIKFSDITWKREWFPSLPKIYWNSMDNRRKFLDKLANTLQIKSNKEWGNVTLQQVHELGGGALLNTYYRGSLFNCLQSVYKGTSAYFWCSLSKMWSGRESGSKTFLDFLNHIGNLRKIVENSLIKLLPNLIFGL